MSDNKQPDALDRLRRRPAPSATPTPVVKDAPLLNDEARKLLEEKSKAAALATKRAAEVGARKSLDAGKAALGKFNSWRHDRAESKAKVEVPVEKLAPLVGITPDEVAEKLSEITVPAQDADPDLQEHVSGYDMTTPASMGVSLVIGETGSGMSQGIDEEARALYIDELGIDEEAQALYIEQRVQQVYEKLSAENPGAIIRRDGASLTVVHPEPIEEVLPEVVEVQVVKAANVRREVVEPTSAANPTKAPNLKPYWIAAAVLAVVALGLMTYKLTQRDAPVAPAVVPISAPAAQPVAPAPTPEPVQVAPSPSPAPVVVEPVPAVIEPAPVIPAPVVEPGVQVIKPKKPVAVEKPVAPPTPKPVAVAKPRSAVKPKAPKPAPAPAVSPESKKQIDSIRDFEKQLENMGG